MVTCIDYVLIAEKISSITIAIYNRVKKKKPIPRKEAKPSPYRLFAIEELPKKLKISSALHGNIEEYVPRKVLEKKLGEDLIPRYRKLLIYGPEGVGKSREAFEIIKRLNDIKPRNVYLGSKREVVIPSKYPPERDIVLFIDDLVIPETRYDEYGEKIRSATLSQSIRGTIQVFEEIEDVDVIFTLRTDRYQDIKREILDVLIDYNFKVIKLDALSTFEKESYIKNLARKLKFRPLTDGCVKTLIKESKDSLKEIYDYFKLREDEGKLFIDEKDTEGEFRKYVRNRRLDEYRGLSENEKIVFNALSNLDRFSVPPFTYLVIELCKSIKKSQEAFERVESDLEDKFEDIIKKLKKKNKIEIIEYEIEADDYLPLLSQEDSNFENDPQLVIQVIDSISKKRTWLRKLKYEGDLYYILTLFTEELYKCGMYEELDKFKFNDFILNLPDRALPPNPKKVRSEILFHKGYNYYSWGRKYWDKSMDCYIRSLELNDQNLFAKHALATLYWKGYKSSKAFNILNEIIELNKKDIIAYKTKLEIQIDTDIDLKEAGKTYIAIGELLKNNTFPFRTALSANLACTRFLLSEVESLREKGEIKESENKFQKAKEQFENIIEEIPPEEYKREAIVRNVYGSYLYDILDKKDEGIAQLEKAHEVWPEHGYTIHKLATICIREGENLEGKERLDYWKKAEDYLKESLNIDPSHYPHYLTKRSLAELKGKSTDWNKLVKSVREGKLSESEFWNKASIIYNKYQDQEALEPETDYPSLHNSIVHNSAGWFLWNLEMSVKDFLQNKDSSIPSADIEFRKSIEIGGKFKDTEGNVIKEILPWKIRKHLAITYEALSSYLTMTGNSRNDQVMVKEGHFFSERYIELSKENGKIIYHSGNASNESYIGKLLLDQGEIDEAIKCFRRSINLCDNNSCALWWLKEIYEKEEGYQDYKKAIKYYGRYAKIQNSPSLYRAVRNTAKKWMKEGQIPYDVDLLIKYSKKGYEIDPNGDMNPKNVSDYAYDLLQKWKGTGNYVILEKAKKLFTYLIKWAIQSIDENPDKEDAYISLIRYYCVPIWKSGQLLNDDIVSEIEACAKRHREYPAARKMIGIVLHRNRKSEKALPYLEEFKDSEDTYVLRSLMEAYSWVEKVKEAEETYKRLYSLLDNEKLKSGLKRHASEMGLKCS